METPVLAKVDFFENGLCLSCHLAKDELADLLLFHTLSENAWEKKDAVLQRELEEILAKYPEADHDDIIDSHSWELHLNQMKFPGIHRESILITIYNYLESELNDICRIISDSIDSPLKLKDLHGKGIERAQVYLSKVAGFDFSAFSPELPYLKKVNLLRNQVVHNGGRLPEGANQELNVFVQTNTNLIGSPGDMVRLRSEFVEEFIKNLEGFFEKLEVEVKLFMNRVNA